MYLFKENINIEEYNEFYKGFSKAPIMQDYAWTKVKNNWGNTICGLYKDNKLVATALILIKKMPFNIKLFYIPRGYLLDFTNKELLEVFTKYIKEYARKNGAYLIKIDPYVAITEKRINPLSEDENYNYFSVNHEEIMNNLKNNGYIHKGFKKNIGAYFQPRYTMAVPLITPNGEFITEEMFLKSLKKNVRNYLGDYQEKRGVIFNYSNKEEDLDEFVRIINMTADRQSISLRNKNYFKRVMDAFGDKAILFFGKVDINKYLDFIEEALKDEKSDKEFNLEQKRVAQNLKETKGDVITASASLVLLPSNEEGIKMAEFIYAGNDVSILPNLKVNNGLTFFRLMYCLGNGYHYANLGGVDGSLEDHLSVFKSKFNPLVLEFIGEYDLPVNKFLYYLINIAEPIAINTYKYIGRLKNKSNTKEG